VEEDVGFRFEFNEEPDTIQAPVPDVPKEKWWKRRIKKDTVQNKPALDFVIDE
jgi:hypothetical protein